MLFGPAYKGIPLVTATAAALADHEHRTCPSPSTARRPRTTARAAPIVGAPLAGRVLIVDDVMTAGTAIRESVEIIRAQGATPPGVLIALDREERGQGERSAVQEVQESYGLPVVERAAAARPARAPGGHRGDGGTSTRCAPTGTATGSDPSRP